MDTPKVITEDSRTAPTVAPDPLRRRNANRQTPAERAIYDALVAVEQLPAHGRQSDAVWLLKAAADAVADAVDGIDGVLRPPTPEIAACVICGGRGWVRLSDDANWVDQPCACNPAPRAALRSLASPTSESTKEEG